MLRIFPGNPKIASFVSTLKEDKLLKAA